MSKHESKHEKKDASEKSPYKIPVACVSNIERPDLEEQGYQIKVVEHPDDHHLVITHGPNHPGHAHHRVSYTFVSDFNPVTGNPVLVMTEGGQLPTEEQVAAYLKHFNEEVAPGALSKARGQDPGKGRDDAISASYAPIQEVAREVQDYTVDGKDCQRLVIEFKPRRKVTRNEHAAAHTHAKK